MIRIVLDTNVIISGFLWEGKPYQLLDLIDSGKIELVLSIEILEEIERVLENEKLAPIIDNAGLSVKMLMNKVCSMAHIINPKIELKLIESDPDDNKFIECALDGKADYIVSGDKHLLEIKEFEGIKIIKPKEFLEII